MSSSRIDIDTLKVDGKGYSSPGRCYLSREDYEMELQVSIDWGNFILRLPVTPPPGVTVADIQAARTILHLEEK